MSKNFELLQQVEFGLGVAPATTAGADVAAPYLAPPTSQSLSSLEPTVREEAQKLVQRLFFASEKNAPKAVVFAGIDESVGSTRVAAVAARVLAASVPGSVCLVEGNLRSPSLATALGMNSESGLLESLRQDGSVRKFSTQIADRLWFLPSKDPVLDSLSLLNSDRMRGRVGELRREFDYLVMNAPPLNSFADGMALGQLLDGVVLVLEANATRREAALRVTENLKTTKIPILGAVLNNRTFPIPNVLYKRL
jgi:Mrp family chromosome partitioning ATPase